MRTLTTTALTEQLELAGALRTVRSKMNEPEDLPGRYGRVIRAVNHVLRAIDSEAVLGGG